MSDPLNEGGQRDTDRDREAVYRFAERMMRKLAANAHKAHWSTVDQSWLVRRVYNEADELNAEVSTLEPRMMSDARLERVINECADVANFAMMIADNCAAELRKRASR